MPQLREEAIEKSGMRRPETRAAEVVDIQHEAITRGGRENTTGQTAENAENAEGSTAENPD